MPDPFVSMKAVLSGEPFDDPDWIFERKLDGIRCGVVRMRRKVQLISRGGETLNDAYPEIEEALAVDGPDLEADGEIVAFQRGQTSFSRLQGRMQIRDRERARASGIAVFHYLFDILELDGEDLRPQPLLERKRALRRAVDFGGPLRFSTHRNGTGIDAYREACRRGWEGVIAKRADAPYHHGRSPDWLKFKCAQGQELVIGGFTDPQGARHGFGALLLGYHEDGVLKYAGKVGTGFDERLLASLHAQLRERETPKSPFAGPVEEKGAHWVRPDLVAQIGFSEWTRDGRLRHPRFAGLREDKKAADVVRERA